MRNMEMKPKKFRTALKVIQKVEGAQFSRCSHLRNSNKHQNLQSTKQFYNNLISNNRYVSDFFLGTQDQIRKYLQNHGNDHIFKRFYYMRWF